MGTKKKKKKKKLTLICDNWSWVDWILFLFRTVCMDCDCGEHCGLGNQECSAPVECQEEEWFRLAWILYPFTLLYKLYFQSFYMFLFPFFVWMCSLDKFIARSLAACISAVRLHSQSNFFKHKCRQYLAGCCYSFKMALLALTAVDQTRDFVLWRHLLHFIHSV